MVANGPAKSLRIWYTRDPSARLGHQIMRRPLEGPEFAICVRHFASQRLVFLLRSTASAIVAPMTDPADKLTPADPHDLADSIAFALKFEGRKRKHDADEYMAKIVAERVVRHLERAGFVVMKKPPLGDHSAIGRGFEG